MKEQKKTRQTTWVDVTMLVNWSGRMTGIQRVEYNIAKRYVEREDVRFCVFDKNSGKLIEFDFSHIEFKINHQQEVVNNSSGTQLQHKTFTSRTVDGMRKVIPSKVKRILKEKHASLSRGRGDLSEISPIANINQGDILIVLSGDWSDSTFANFVAQTKRDHQIKVIQIVYDMLPALFPSYFVMGMPKQFSDYMEKMLSFSDLVLVISESTKRDVAAFMKQRAMLPIPIEVFRLGDDFVKTKAKYPEASNLKDKDYILTVCTVEARKNHLVLYYAMREAVMQGIDMPIMVFAGKKGWLVDDLYYTITNDPIMSEKIIFVDQPTDSELAWLYENCLFTVFPSFYEGWGLPVAESLFNGKFCLSSNASSMPEIAGDLIDYFSPNDPVGVLKKIRRYYEDRQALKAKEATILSRYKTSTWDTAFQQVDQAVETTHA